MSQQRHLQTLRCAMVRHTISGIGGNNMHAPQLYRLVPHSVCRHTDIRLDACCPSLRSHHVIGGFCFEVSVNVLRRIAAIFHRPNHQ